MGWFGADYKLEPQPRSPRLGRRLAGDRSQSVTLVCESARALYGLAPCRWSGFDGWSEATPEDLEDVARRGRRNGRSTPGPQARTRRPSLPQNRICSASRIVMG